MCGLLSRIAWDPVMSFSFRRLRTIRPRHGDKEIERSIKGTQTNLVTAVPCRASYTMRQYTNFAVSQMKNLLYPNQLHDSLADKCRTNKPELAGHFDH